jgi:hypothetical protein
MQCILLLFLNFCHAVTDILPAVVCCIDQFIMGIQWLWIQMVMFTRKHVPAWSTIYTSFCSHVSEIHLYLQIVSVGMFRWGFGGYGRFVLSLTLVSVSRAAVDDWSILDIDVEDFEILYTTQYLLCYFTFVIPWFCFLGLDIESRRMNGSLGVWMSSQSTMFCLLMQLFQLDLWILHVLQVSYVSDWHVLLNSFSRDATNHRLDQLKDPINCQKSPQISSFLDCITYCYDCY